MPASRSHLIPPLVAPIVATLLLLPSAVPASAATHPGSDPSHITVVGSRVFFAATAAAHGRELWVSDGTAAGTYEVKDINPAGDSNPSELTAVGNAVFFFADDGSGGALWKSDGTAAGTTRLGGSSGNDLTNVNGRLFFQTETELWTSDGTVGGTRVVATAAMASWWLSAVLGGFYYFFTASGDQIELRRSDGTSAGTSLVAEIPAVSDEWPLEAMVASGNRLYFLMEISDESTTGTGYGRGKLWQSDGTAAGTRKVRDFDPETDEDLVSYDLTDLGGTLYFGAADENGVALWKSDGTVSGTRIVKRIRPHELTAIGSRLLIFVDNGDWPPTPTVLWRSKGTKRTTVEVYPIALPSCPWPGNAPYCGLDATPAVVGSRLFFPGTEPGSGTELWVSDGTATGTHIVKNIGYRAASSDPSDLVSAGSLLYFTAREANHGRELWVSDGTARGTHMVLDINPG